jgi:flagellar assembly protein FliH
MGMQNYISAERGKTLPPAAFPQFESRPANYFRDVFAEEIRHGDVKLNEQEFNARVEELLADERRQRAPQHEQELRQRFEAGLAQGRSEGAAEFARAVEMLQAYGTMLQAEKNELAAKAEQSALELAFTLARKIVGDELQARPAAVGEIVKMAIRQVLDCDQIRLRVNADDLEHLRSIQSDLEGMLSKNTPLEIRADQSVERGGCLIETERGNLDARISSQLDTLRAGLQAKS